MPNSKFQWISPNLGGIEFNDDYYLYLSNTLALNALWVDFRIVMVIYPDSTAANPTWNHLIFNKGVDIYESGNIGYYAYIRHSDRFVCCGINDGSGGNAKQAYADNVILLDDINVLVFQFRRADLASIYLNGEFVCSGDISGMQGDISNSTFFTLFPNGFKGKLHYFSFMYTLYSEEKIQEEYWKIKYGWKTQLIRSAYNWRFNETLKSESSSSSSYEFLLNSGTPNYVAYNECWPYETNYTVPQNINYEYEFDYIPPLDKVFRGRSGAAKISLGPEKRRAVLSFVGMGLEQKTALEGMYFSGRHDVRWFKSSDQLSPTMRCAIIQPLDIVEFAPGRYACQIHLEEL